MPKRVLLLSTVAILAACSSNVTNATGTGASTGTGTGGSTSTAQTYTVTWGPVTVMPGVENTQCVVKKLGNPTAFHAGTIHNLLNVGSHHLIVYKTNDTVEQTTPFACQPFTDLAHPEKGTPLMISQKKDDTLSLPAGVALALNADQFVRLELHYINTSTAPLDVSASSTFVTIPDAEVQNEAGFLFLGDIDISIPPQSMATVGPIFAPEPTAVAGSKYFGITGHEHQWGTDVTVATTTGPTGTDTPIYNVPGWTWNEPKTVYLDPPVTVPAGGGFRYTCTWNNLSASTVGFGESANNEMCFFWAYYYPALTMVNGVSTQGSEVCLHTDQLGSLNACCPGDSLCATIQKHF